MIAYDDKIYGEIVLHPPPLSYVSILMVPFLVHKKSMRLVSTCFAYSMFWAENLLFVFLFFIVEIIICPFAYMKIWWNIIFNSQSFFKILMSIIIFAIIGIPMILFLVLRDCAYVIYILSFH